MVNKVYRELPDLVWESPNRVEGKAVDSCLILSRYRDNLFYARKLMSDGSYILRLYDIDNFVEFAVPSHRDWANTQVPHLISGSSCYIFSRNADFAVIDKLDLPLVPNQIRVSKKGVLSLHNKSSLVHIILKLTPMSYGIGFKDGDSTNLRRDNLTLLFRGIKSNNGLPVGIKKSKKGSYQVRLTYNGTNVCNTFNSLENAAAYRSELEHNLIYHGNVYGKD